MVKDEDPGVLPQAEQIAGEFDIPAEDIQRITRHFVAQLSEFSSKYPLRLTNSHRRWTRQPTHLAAPSLRAQHSHRH